MSSLVSSCHVIAGVITSCHIWRHHVVSYLASSCRVIFGVIMSRVISGAIMSCHLRHHHVMCHLWCHHASSLASSCRVIFGHVSSLAPSCHVISGIIMSCVISGVTMCHLWRHRVVRRRFQSSDPVVGRKLENLVLDDDLISTANHSNGVMQPASPAMPVCESRCHVLTLFHVLT